MEPSQISIGGTERGPPFQQQSNNISKAGSPIRSEMTTPCKKGRSSAKTLEAQNPPSLNALLVPDKPFAGESPQQSSPCAKGTLS
eukprot:1767718-Amphidinium_carterae.1